MIKGVIISGSITTGSATTYYINTERLALGSATASTFNNYPTGKTIVNINGLSGSANSSAARCILEVSGDLKTLWCWGSPSAQYGCYFLCLYKG